MTPLPCPGCLAVPTVEPYRYGPEWQLLCPDCYDGTEDAGDIAHLGAVSTTIADTIWQWNVAVEMITDGEDLTAIRCDECDAELDGRPGDDPADEHVCHDCVRMLRTEP